MQPGFRHGHAQGQAAHQLGRVGRRVVAADVAQRIHDGVGHGADFRGRRHGPGFARVIVQGFGQGAQMFHDPVQGGGLHFDDAVGTAEHNRFVLAGFVQALVVAPGLGFDAFQKIRGDAVPLGQKRGNQRVGEPSALMIL